MSLDEFRHLHSALLSGGKFPEPPAPGNADDFVAKLFAKCAGADGKMDAGELKALLLSALANADGGSKAPPMSVDRAMAEYDTDKSGFLSLDEFRHLHAKLLAPAKA